MAIICEWQVFYFQTTNKKKKFLSYRQDSQLLSSLKSLFGSRRCPWWLFHMFKFYFFWSPGPTAHTARRRARRSPSWGHAGSGCVRRAWHHSIAEFQGGIAGYRRPRGRRHHRKCVFFSFRFPIAWHFFVLEFHVWLPAVVGREAEDITAGVFFLKYILCWARLSFLWRSKV